jgi:antitoxin FitA
MATVTIRNLDDTTVDRLKTKAREHNRSLEAEIRLLLTEAAARPSRRSFLDLSDRIAAMTPKNIAQTDSVDLIREDRDR